MDTQQAQQEREDILSSIAEEHGLDEGAVIAYCDNYHISAQDFPDHVSDFLHVYNGWWDDFLDFATEVFDDTMDVPDYLVHYIDYEAFARDLKHDYWEHDGHVFRNL